MTHRIQAVKAMDNYIVQAIFFDGQIVNYDMKQLFSTYSMFKTFEEEKGLFAKVKVDQGGYGISWNDDLDLDAETIWEGGVLLEVQKCSNFNHLLAYKLLAAREEAKITQKELSEITGIYQADISKLERGIGNPSVSTLRRIAEGLGMDLQIEFIRK